MNCSFSHSHCLFNKSPKIHQNPQSRFQLQKPKCTIEQLTCHIFRLIIISKHFFPHLRACFYAPKVARHGLSLLICFAFPSLYARMCCV